MTNIAVQTPNEKLHFFNTKEIIANMEELIRFFKQDRIAYNKKDYINALNSMQGNFIPVNDKIEVTFDHEDLYNRLIIKDLLKDKNVKFTDHLFSIDEQQEIMKNIEEAFELLNTINPSIMNTMRKVIGAIACYKVEGYVGGSVSSSIGVIWLHPPKHWKIEDYAEAIYHEFIHHCLYLDDMIYAIFPNQEVANSPEAMTISSILTTKRSIDKAYHSAVVAIGIMYMYHKLGNDKKALTFLPNIKRTSEELNTKHEFLGERGIEILEGMNYFTEHLNYDDIHSLIHE
ncbi:aKG-HExxH-type peptide beta-hydroxylase [Peribacillus castrilensis]|uniref:aKG-HExxH-type peptide beta-hydroxylase n=1 Tax=Bacillaceae TaxID=186817 RepID=UPI000A64AA54|nr:MULTISPECIES: HEXXH motif-containing putative peptide modification protein [Bacillaceae]